MIRDTKTNALINDDAAALHKYKAERNQNRKIEQLLRDMEQVKITLKRVCETLDRIEKA